jgi:hypothetical protein
MPETNCRSLALNRRKRSEPPSAQSEVWHCVIEMSGCAVQKRTRLRAWRFPDLLLHAPQDTPVFEAGRRNLGAESRVDALPRSLHFAGHPQIEILSFRDTDYRSTEPRLLRRSRYQSLEKPKEH